MTGLPVARLLLPPAASANYYAVTAIDGRGRLADRSPLRFLGWQPLCSVSIAVPRQGLIVARGVAGSEHVTRQGHLRIPARIRHVCRLRAGDRLLVVAHPTENALVVYPTGELDAILPGGWA